MTALSKGIDFILEHVSDNELREYLSNCDIKTQLHQLNSTRQFKTSTVILSVAKYLYDKEKEDEALKVINLIDILKVSQNKLHQTIKDLLLLDLKRHQEYLLYSNDPWNCALITAFNGSSLALDYILEWKKLWPNDSKSILLLLYLKQFDEIKVEMQSQMTEEGLRDICTCYLRMQWPHLALPYVTKLHLLNNEVETKFMSFIDRCRCLIFMNNTEEALSLLNEGQHVLELSEENQIWLNLTYSLVYLTSHQFTRFYHEISKVTSHTHFDDISDDMNVSLLEMLLYYFLHTGRPERAIVSAQTLLKVLLSSNDDKYNINVVNCYAILGNIFMALHNVKMAEVCFMERLEKASAVAVPQLMVRALSDMVLYYRTVKNTELRYHYLKEELQILSKYDGSESINFEWTVRFDYGIYLLDELQYEEAEEELEKALLSVQELHLSVEEAKITEMLAEVAQKLNEEEKTYCRYKASLNIWKTLPYTNKIENLTVRLIQCMELQNKNKEGREVAKTLLTTTKSYKIKVPVAICLAKILMKDKLYDETFIVLERAKKEAKVNGMAKQLGQVYGLLGEFYQAIGNQKMATRNFCKQIDYFDFVNDPQDQTDTFRHIIMYKLLKSDINAALKVIKMRIAAAEKGTMLLQINVLNESIKTLSDLNLTKEGIKLLDKKAELILSSDHLSNKDEVLTIVSQYKSINLYYKAQITLATFLKRNLDYCDKRHFLELASLLQHYDIQLCVDLLESVIETDHFHVDLVAPLCYRYLEMGATDKVVELFNSLTAREVQLNFFSVLTVSKVQENIKDEQCVEMAMQLNETDQCQFMDMFNLYSYITDQNYDSFYLPAKVHYLLYIQDFDRVKPLLQDVMSKEHILYLTLQNQHQIHHKTQDNASKTSFDSYIDYVSYNNNDFDFVTFVLMLVYSDDKWRSIYICEYRKRLKVKLELDKIGKGATSDTSNTVNMCSTKTTVNTLQFQEGTTVDKPEFEFGAIKNNLKHDETRLAVQLQEDDDFLYIFKYNNFKLLWQGGKEKLIVTTVSTLNTAKTTDTIQSNDLVSSCTRSELAECFWEYMVLNLIKQYHIDMCTRDEFEEKLQKATVLYGDSLDHKINGIKHYFVPTLNDEKDTSIPVQGTNEVSVLKEALNSVLLDISSTSFSHTHEASVLMVGKMFEDYKRTPGFIHLLTQEDVFQTVDQVSFINKATVLLVDPVELNPLFLLQTEANPKILVLVGSTWSHLPLWPAIVSSVKVLVIYKSFDEFEHEAGKYLIEKVNEVNDDDIDIVDEIKNQFKNGILCVNNDVAFDIQCKSVKLRCSLQKAINDENVENWLVGHKEIRDVIVDQVTEYLKQDSDLIVDSILNSAEPHRSNLQHLFHDYCITHPTFQSDLNPRRQHRYRSKRRKNRRRSRMSSRCSSRSSMASDINFLSEADISDTESVSHARLVGIGME
ncbi:unnamed protein product [Bursaphelenchus okinawaensis]|uniref:TPR_REGION domain-containing protein n=1 Tax=Bursaphelenchus okinawaensis TaxID=465554 RepID=A0A811KHP7_9BILA|nr:unnamed protein product [Bursaphelenchus okinawaensis]CAG9103110.1 unnamed protein product [Bursaphelenchus okinawaensis]